MKTWKHFWVYKITNKVTNESYVGQTCHLAKRYSDHSFARCGSGVSRIKRSILKYGWDNHAFEILFSSTNVTKTNGDLIERHFIRTHKTFAYEHPSGMNLTKGGSRGVHTEAELNAMINTKFLRWKRLQGKSGVPLEVYDREGKKVFDHFGNLKDLAQALNLEYTRKFYGAVCKNIAKHGLFNNKWFIQWPGQNKYAEHLNNRESLYRQRRGKIWSEDHKRRWSVTFKKILSKPVLDTQTGVYYDSITILAANVGVERRLFNGRLRNNFYNNRYVA